MPEASFGDMVRASKLLVLAMLLWMCVGVAQAQTPPSTTVQQVTELQFELARSLAQAGEHDAAAREFDRALTLQRQGAQATAEQTQAALQTLHAYVQSRPELPRMREIGHRLATVERQAPPRPVFGPTAAIGAAAPQPPPSIVPNAPPSTPLPDTGVTINPYRHPTPSHGRAPSTLAARGGESRTHVVSATAAGTQPSIQLHLPRRAGTSTGRWWEQMTLSADELLIPSEWSAALAMRTAGTWPQLVMGWPELLVPPGWENVGRGLAAQLLVDAELLVPPGW